MQQGTGNCGGVPDEDGLPRRGFLCPHRGAGNPVPKGEGHRKRRGRSAPKPGQTSATGDDRGSAQRQRGRSAPPRDTNDTQHARGGTTTTEPTGGDSPGPVGKPGTRRPWARARRRCFAQAAGAVQSRPKRGCRAPVGHSGSHEHPTPNKGQCGRGQQKHGANEREEDASREPRTAVWRSCGSLPRFKFPYIPCGFV